MAKVVGSQTEKTGQVLDNATSVGGDGSNIGEGTPGKDVARKTAANFTTRIRDDLSAGLRVGTRPH